MISHLVVVARRWYAELRQNKEVSLMDREESIMYAKKYTEDLMSFFGLNVDVYASAEEDVIELSIPSSYLSNILIGRGGETLRSIQTLIRSTLIQKKAELFRVNLDIADYKKRHNEQLATKAEKWAKKVLATGEPMELEPMNPAERRVIHKVLGDYTQLSTDSEGTGAERHIVIKKIAE